MATFLRLSLVCWLLFGAAVTEAQQPQYSMGLELLSSEDYLSLPKTQRYRAFLPPKVDLSPMFPLPGNQGRQPSCVGWAVAYGARSYYEATTSGRQMDEKSSFSPAYIYNQLRKGTEGCTSGLNLLTALKLVQSQGVANLSDFPYVDSSCEDLPSSQTKISASVNKIDSWRTISFGDIESVKGELYKRNPVIVGMKIPNSFKKLRGTEIFAELGNYADGRHAMVIVAYDDTRGAFKVLNSWGRNWGEGGFGWISYAAMADRGAEYFVIQAPAVKPEPMPLPNLGQEKKLTPESKPITPSRAEVIGKINEVIARVECGQLAVSFGGDGTVTMTGFIGEADRLHTLSQKISAIQGVTRIESKVRIAPWPICETYLTLEQ